MWQEPKIDWKSSYASNGDYTGDHFNIEDYNRIKDNLTYLIDFANTLYIPFSSVDMGADKIVEGDYKASEFNALETNLETINTKAYHLNIGTKQTYMNNGKFIDFTELNRIESACLKYYNLFNTQLANLSTIPLTCGNRIGDNF